MHSSTLIGAAAASAILGISITCSAQAPAVHSIDEAMLREYSGAYQWGPNAFVYLQLWNELTGTNQLLAFDESREVRVLFPTERDRFFTGPGVAVAAEVESRINFERDRMGKITSLTWRREGASPRIARRVETERWEDVRFADGDVQLAGTLITPRTNGRHPAVILVHGSGPTNREWTLPFARFLLRRGMAILTYDKRGVGGSTGDWNTASFADLASDVVAAFEYLKTRHEIDGTQIGLLGVSQAGWVMPLAAVRAPDLAFLISISGPGVPAAETTIGHAQREMTAAGMRPEVVSQIIDLMHLQYRFARTGQGWDEYAAARQNLVSRLGSAPESFPGTHDHPSWPFIRRLYFYDPAPTLRQLQLPVLALFGELDNNILAEKNKAAWEAALAVGGNPDFTLQILPKANHIMLEAEVGNNAEMASLQRFVPGYYTIIQDWLARRIRGFSAPLGLIEARPPQ